MPEYQAARTISVYLSMPGGEISTSEIVRNALDEGKKVFIPYTYTLDAPKQGQPKSIMDMVELQSMKDFESLESDKWGIPTPSKDSISSRANCFGGTGITNGETEGVSAGLDLIVMPGMAFDSQFGRVSSDALEKASGIALQADGKIVAAGLARNGSSGGLGIVRVVP